MSLAAGSEWRITKGGIVMKTNGALQQDVKDRILSSFHCKALPDSRRITVETRGGWVILRGSVRSWAEKAEAQWAAFTARGVFDVENNIIISPWANEEILFGTHVK
jgi:osmotically-inducible protein OsmY